MLKKFNFKEKIIKIIQIKIRKVLSYFKMLQKKKTKIKIELKNQEVKLKTFKEMTLCIEIKNKEIQLRISKQKMFLKKVNFQFKVNQKKNL